MSVAVAAKVYTVLAMEKLVFIRRSMQGSDQLTGSCFVEIDLKVFMARRAVELASVRLNHSHSPLLDLQNVANEKKLTIDG
jgi:hypothetical protein